MPDNDLLEALTMAQRALAKLEEKAAGHGSLEIPTSLQIELEDKRKEVTELEVRYRDHQSQVQNTWVCSLLPEHAYAFENRKDDVRKIFDLLEAEPYLHLFAPSGIGKTYLVQHLQCEKYTQRPFAYLDFNAPQFRPLGRSIEALLVELLRQFGNPSASLSQPLVWTDLLGILGQTLRSYTCYGVLVLDNVDHVAPGIRHKLREEILPALQARLVDPRRYIRFIAIAQTQMPELSGIGHISFQPYALEAFHGGAGERRTYKSLLRQALIRFSDRKLADDDPRDDDLLNEWAIALFDLTGGHPGAIVASLNHLGQQTHFSKHDVFAEQQQLICQNVLTPLLDQQVQACLSRQEHQAAFGLLWIFRHLSKGFFRQLLHAVRDKAHWQSLTAATREADYSAEHAPLWDRFTETPLLQPTGHHRLLTHQLTPIWRRMGNLILQTNDPELYARLHHDARQVFDSLAIKNPGYDPGMRVDCFVESVYHRTQEIFTPLPDQAQNEFTQSLLEYFQEFLVSLSEEIHFEEYLHNLNALILHDQLLLLALQQVDRNIWQQIQTILRNYAH